MVEKVFDYAASVMGGINSADIETQAERDPIFRSVLSKFHKKPVRVFQVGAIETFSRDWRTFSGWSDIIWGEYIREYGGALTVADIDLDHLALSAFAANSLDYRIHLCFDDAINVILAAEYDIYYLDGSNDPQETLDQYEKIKHKDAVVIIDDYDIKGTLINEEEIKSMIKYNVFNGVTVIDNLKQGVNQEG